MSDLRTYYGRVSNLTEEKDAVSESIKDVFKEIKGAGYDPALARQAFTMMDKMTADERQEYLDTLTLYVRTCEGRNEAV